MTALTPWYLTAEALEIIERLYENKPELTVYEKTYVTSKDRGGRYESADADALRALCGSEYDRLNAAPKWDDAAAKALILSNADEILAALYGCPDDLDWAHPDRAARRVAIAGEIDAALGWGVAA